jgi:hypothetical protein
MAEYEGIERAARTAMMAITTMSSTRLKPVKATDGLCLEGNI